jgi:hypothetical protein
MEGAAQTLPLKGRPFAWSGSDLFTDNERLDKRVKSGRNVKERAFLKEFGSVISLF